MISRHRPSFSMTSPIVVVVTTLAILVRLVASFPPDSVPLATGNATESGKFSVFFGKPSPESHPVPDPTPGSNGTDPKPVEDEAERLTDLHGVAVINSSIFIHARNHIYRLKRFSAPVDSSTDHHYGFAQDYAWNVTSPRAVTSCLRSATDKKRDCHNHVLLLRQLRHNVTNQLTNHVVACASQAYEPELRYFTLSADGELAFDEARTNSTDAMLAQFYCPPAPGQVSTSMAHRGNLYVALADRERDSFVARHREMSDQNALRTQNKNGRQEGAVSEGSEFVRFVPGSAGTNKILIFFNEYAREDRDHRKLARVGQVCANDEQSMESDQFFTSFFKSSLNCSLPGFPPFYFDTARAASRAVVLNVTGASSARRVVFVVMRTPSNQLNMSAVCVYAVDQIERALHSNQMERFKDAWYSNNEAPYKNLADCRTHVTPPKGRRLLNSTDEIDYIERHPLVASVVPAFDILGAAATSSGGGKSGPIITSRSDMYTTITVDGEELSARHDGDAYAVVWTGTEDGAVVKSLVHVTAGHVTAVERRHVFDERRCGTTSREVRSIAVDREGGNAYVAFSGCLVAVPLCSRLGNASSECECARSRDPYCRWEAASERCVTAVGGQEGGQDLRGERWREECPRVVVLATPTLVPTGKSPEVTTDNGTLAGDSAASSSGKVKTAGGGGGGETSALLAILAACIGCFVGVIVTSVVLCCCNPDCVNMMKRKRLNRRLASTASEATSRNGVSRTNSTNQNNRLDSESSNPPPPPLSPLKSARQKHPSESSNKSHYVISRASHYEGGDGAAAAEQPRKRHVTDGSGERSRNESTTTANAKTPTATAAERIVACDFAAAYEEQTRKSRKVSTTSKSSQSNVRINGVLPPPTGGEGGTLSKKSGNPLLDDVIANDAVFARQMSTESAKSNTGGAVQQQTLPHHHHHHNHHELRRSYSVQQPNNQHQSTIHRNQSFGPGQPHHHQQQQQPAQNAGRGLGQLGRQHSFQVIQRPQELRFAPAGTISTPAGKQQAKWHPKTPMAPPPAMMVPVAQALGAVGKGMTYSLDRRKLKAFPPHQGQNEPFIQQRPIMSSSVPKEAGHFVMMPNPQHHQHHHHNQQQRKRYVSESVTSQYATPHHPAAAASSSQGGALPYAPILEDPTSGYATGNRGTAAAVATRRDHMRLDLSRDPNMTSSRRRPAAHQETHPMMKMHNSPMERRSFNFPPPQQLPQVAHITPAATPVEEEQRALLTHQEEEEEAPLQDQQRESDDDDASSSMTSSLPPPRSPDSFRSFDGKHQDEGDDDGEITYTETVA